MEARADAQLAACLIVDNEGEVALGKIAKERAQSQQVKQFAEQLIKDHSEMLTRLQKFAGGAGAEGRPRAAANDAAGAQATRPAADQPGAAERPSDRARAGGAQRGGAINFVALKRELGQQCLQSARKELESKEGQEFDMCYTTMMIVKHMQALDTLKVFKNHASDEFAQALDEASRTVTTHLEHAKDLGKQLHKQAVATARRDSEANK
jgi:predicted outer membrane protein